LYTGNNRLYTENNRLYDGELSFPNYLF
jgi:hypothetical protein